MVVTAASAEALAGLPLKPPPRLPPLPIPVQSVPHAQYARALEQARSAPRLYGGAMAGVKPDLDALRKEMIARLDRGINRVIVPTDNPSAIRQARDALWTCAGDGVQSTASAVDTAIAEGSSDAKEAYLQAAADCLRGRFSDSDSNALAQYLLNLIAGSVEQAGQTTQEVADATAAQQVAAQQLWLEAAAEAIGERGRTTTAPTPPTEIRPGGSSAVPWLLAAGATSALALAVLVALRRRHRRQTGLGTPH